MDVKLFVTRTERQNEIILHTDLGESELAHELMMRCESGLVWFWREREGGGEGSGSGGEHKPGEGRLSQAQT